VAALAAALAQNTRVREIYLQNNGPHRSCLQPLLCSVAVFLLYSAYTS
jgi:hypothetical protein